MSQKEKWKMKKVEMKKGGRKKKEGHETGRRKGKSKGND